MPSCENIHVGHRERMREKLFFYGHEVFHPHELVEMLLYTVVPYRDTNPLAKTLLARFGSLDALFRASAEELKEVEGVGDKVAALIVAAGSLQVSASSAVGRDGGKNLSHFVTARNFVFESVGDETEEKAFAFYLNNRMELIASETLYTGVPFPSAAVRPKPFLRGAVRVGASAVILAHNHPYGPFVATPSDRETHRMLVTAYHAAGIIVPEHFIVTHTTCAGIDEGAPPMRLRPDEIRQISDDSGYEVDAALADAYRFFLRTKEEAKK